MVRKIEITTLSALTCSDRYACPAVHALSDRPDVYYLVVKRNAVVVDPDELAALAGLVGDDEMVVTQPRAVLDQLTPTVVT